MSETLNTATVALHRHPSALDKTASRVWTELTRKGIVSVYRVTEGFVAVLPHSLALSGHYQTQQGAIAAIREANQ